MCDIVTASPARRREDVGPIHLLALGLGDELVSPCRDLVGSRMMSRSGGRGSGLGLDG